MTTKKKEAERLLPTHVIVVLASFAAGIFLVVITAHAIGWTADWDHASKVGDFLGGHMSVLALVFVTIGLLLQERSLRAQIDEMKSTVEVLSTDVEQDNLQFMMQHIRDASQAMKATAVVPNGPDAASGETVVLLTGLDEILPYLREGRDPGTGVRVFTYRRSMQAYSKHVERARTLLERIRSKEAESQHPDNEQTDAVSPQLEVTEGILEAFMPEVLRKSIERDTQLHAHTSAEVQQLLPQERAERVIGLLDDGWILELEDENGRSEGNMLRLRANGSVERLGPIPGDGLTKADLIQLLIDRV